MEFSNWTMSHGKEGRHAFGDYDKKKSGRSEVWTVRASDGVRTATKTSAGSVLSMDKAAKRYAGALKRLAKR